jgi:hypothetical protein
VSDPLENELAALRPRPVSPELRDRVAERLNAPAPSRRWIWGVAFVGVLAAVGAIALVVPNRKEPSPPVPPAVVPSPSPAPAVAEPESPPPSVLVYRRALARSPEALDALLDQQVAVQPDAGLMPVGMFHRSPGTINGFIGDD